MKRKVLSLGVVVGAALCAFGIARADAVVSDNCWNEDNPTEIGTPGPVGLGFESGNDTGNAAFYQHICYRVHNPQSGAPIVGGVIKPYQYYWPGAGSAAGGVQCLPDSSSSPVPYCYIVYGAFTSASTSGVGVSGWAGESAATGIVIVPGAGVDVSGLASPVITGTQLGVDVLTPDVCVVVNATGGCTGRVPLGANLATNDAAPASPLGVPTGVDPDATGTPLLSVTVGPTTEHRDVPLNCIGVC